MRILAFSDLHRDRDQARALVRMAAEADVVVGAGDFASIHLGLRPTIAVLREITVPTMLVPGNNETEKALRRECEAWPQAEVLHGERRTVDGVDFFGLGLAVPITPFPWSADLTEDQARPLLAPCPPGAVLISHSPPKGHVDSARGRHLGSHAVLDAIAEKCPRLVLCGHIHEAWGEESLVGASRVVNLGPAGRFFDV